MTLNPLEKQPRSLPYGIHPLDVFFNPRSIALIGATNKPKSVGRTILWNLVSYAHSALIYPVNPKYSSLYGFKAYPSIESISDPIDLAVIVVPNTQVLELVQSCANKGVKGLIIISAGFKELGPKGIILEKNILEIIRAYNIRVIGPNCLGVMNPITGINATFAGTMALPGNLGFISQSGALCTAILDWSLQEKVGFSAFISVGSMMDVNWGDLIYYLGDDPNTKSILLYMETIGDAQSFLSAAREVALSKPIIVIKAGRSKEASQAATSHTGSLAGSDEVLDAAFKRCGVLRVNSISDLFYMAQILSKQNLPKGNRLTILTNAGGPGVLATDALVREEGRLAELSLETIKELDQILPKSWSKSNPVDILGDADPERFEKAMAILQKDQNSDAILAILTPQDMTEPTDTALALKRGVYQNAQPIIASWMGGNSVEAGRHILAEARIPVFPYPDTAARVFNYMWQYHQYLKSLYETPVDAPESRAIQENRNSVRSLINKALGESRTILTEYEAKKILQLYQIPVVQTEFAHSSEEAVSIAAQIGFPVVLKLHSYTLTHKSDVGGVILNLKSKEEVRAAFEKIQKNVTQKKGVESFQGVTVQSFVDVAGYELIMGSSIDPQLGPVLLFGAGGYFVELYQDHAIGLPPLNTTLARRLMEQTKIYKVFKGFRGARAIDIAEVEKIMVNFSRLVMNEPRIKEIDINPILVSAEKIIALDARIILHPIEVADAELPKPVIRPYPYEYMQKTILKNRQEVMIRPIKPEDEPLMVKFHRRLSEESIYLRYFHMISLEQRIAHDRLSRVCFVDYDRQIVLVAEYRDDQLEREIVGVARLNKIYGTSHAEFAVLVRDDWQGRGLGSYFMKRLLEIAQLEKITQLYGHALSENTAIQKLCTNLKFQIEHNTQDKQLMLSRQV